MAYFYGILSVIGWTWSLALVAIFERELVKIIVRKDRSSERRVANAL
ncbi:hypothetical protein BH09PLA1_BH09PLA1_15580 [soil metagenome]